MVFAQGPKCSEGLNKGRGWGLSIPGTVTLVCKRTRWKCIKHEGRAAVATTKFIMSETEGEGWGLEGHEFSEVAKGQQCDGLNFIPLQTP